jgi:hypothetical protein
LIFHHKKVTANAQPQTNITFYAYTFIQLFLHRITRFGAAKLLRKQILNLFKEMRLCCPNSNSICSKVSLRRIGKRSDVEQEEFELHLKWVPDEPSRTFLKAFVLKHDLGMSETGRQLTIYTSNEVITNALPFRLNLPLKKTDTVSKNLNSLSTTNSKMEN